MTNVQHQKFQQLMVKVEELEDKIVASSKVLGDTDNFTDLKMKLAEARNELEKVSNGCGSGRNPS